MKRRDFIHTTAATLTLATLNTACRTPNLRTQELRNSTTPQLAFIGLGTRGAFNLSAALKCGVNVTALCDVDPSRLQYALKLLPPDMPQPRLYSDYRLMLATEPHLNAVVISTPLHNHAPHALAALDRGCHIYLETPLVHNRNELTQLVRKLRSTRRLMQNGCTTTASPEFRQAVALLRSGILGRITAIHAWTNRPVWPQGSELPATSDPLPPGFDWHSWLGAAPPRPYKRHLYHPFNWRGWHDFGAGALGDAGTQLLSLPFFALPLSLPRKITALSKGATPHSYPRGSTLHMQFKTPGWRRPPLNIYWYEGLDLPNPELLNEAAATHTPLPPAATLLIGDRGFWLSSNDRGNMHHLRLRNENRMVPLEQHPLAQNWLNSAASNPRLTSATLSAPLSQMHEFIDTIRGNTTLYTIPGRGSSPILPLTATLLAGCAAQRNELSMLKRL